MLKLKCDTHASLEAALVKWNANFVAMQSLKDGTINNNSGQNGKPTAHV